MRYAVFRLSTSLWYLSVQLLKNLMEWMKIGAENLNVETFHLTRRKHEWITDGKVNGKFKENGLVFRPGGKFRRATCRNEFAVLRVEILPWLIRVNSMEWFRVCKTGIITQMYLLPWNRDLTQRWTKVNSCKQTDCREDWKFKGYI